MIELKGWQELPPGGVIPEGGSARYYETGAWRTYRPVWDLDRCIHCLLCWVYCPDSAVIVQEGRIVGTDLRYCKGCGICARECPPKIKAVKMVMEHYE